MFVSDKQAYWDKRDAHHSKTPMTSEIMMKHFIFDWGAVAAVKAAWCTDTRHRETVLTCSRQTHCAPCTVAGTSASNLNEYSNEDRVINEILSHFLSTKYRANPHKFLYLAD